MRVELVEPADHRQSVVDGARRVPGAQGCFARAEIDRPGHRSIGQVPLTLRVGGRAQPTRQHRDLGLRRPLPPGAQQPQQAEPPQHPVAVAATGQRAGIPKCQVPQKRGDRLDLGPRRIEHRVRRMGPVHLHHSSEARDGPSALHQLIAYIHHLLLDRGLLRRDQRGGDGAVNRATLARRRVRLRSSRVGRYWLHPARRRSIAMR